MNNIDTSRMDLEALLKTYPEVSVSELNDINQWEIVTKTKPIKAKHLSALLIDNSVQAKFLVETLEGKEPLKKDSVIVLGDAGDIWQQSATNLLKKYTVTEILQDGWMVCVPKDGNESLMYKVATLPDTTAFGFCIRGQYGEERMIDGVKVQLQFGLVGDYILGSKDDPTDRWIVRRGLFDQTYEIKAAIETKIIKFKA